MIGEIGKVAGNWSKVEKYLADHGITKYNAWQNKEKAFDILTKLGIDKKMVDKFIPVAKGGYKIAKSLGKIPKDYENLDVDKCEKEIRKLFKLDNTVPSYDHRRVDDYDGIGYSRRADTLPE